MRARRLRSPPAIAFVGTYPPTRCGIATFTAALADAITTVLPGCRVGIVACVDEEPRGVRHQNEVVAQLAPGSEESRAAATRALEEFDVAVVQHEFGIYGGEDGAEVLDLVRGLRIPSIVVLHTIPRRPTPRQRAIVDALAKVAYSLVVQSDAARVRLLEQYVVEPAGVTTIPHGARVNLSADGRRRAPSRAPIVLTWGLLGSGKGIEWGIEAVARLRDLDPPPRYVVVGQTHPRVLERNGEEYRRQLVARAADLGVAHLVEFDDAYRDTASLLARIRGADIVLLPYRSREQVVSGVLVEAIASGKPVVATRFPHAEELLAQGSGLLVPYEDAGAIAEALRLLLTDPVMRSRAERVARQQARMLAWESVGASYLSLVREAVGRSAPAAGQELPPPAFEHLLRLSDDAGVFEHATLTTPRREHGYCTDDVARALIALLREPVRSPQLEQLAETCLTFLEQAQLPDGRFRNRRSVDGSWLDEADSDDSCGRALWALGVASVAAPTPRQRERARAALVSGAGLRTAWPRSNAFAVLGAAEALPSLPGRHAIAVRELLEAAAQGLGTVSTDGEWPWPEPRLAYANAVLAEARIVAGIMLGDEGLVDEGVGLLSWLVSQETLGDHFSFTPTGGRGPGDDAPAFDQQPIEAAAMATACSAAFDLTGEDVWADRALRAVAWFVGANDVGVELLDPATGGCRDGLTPTGVNANEGAESTIALISALQVARRLQAHARRAPRSSAVSTLAAPMHRSAAPYVR